MAGEAGQEWAQLIRDAASDVDVISVIRAINNVTASYRANRAAVIVACAQILAQDITGEPEVAAEIRAGIRSMIDGYAIQVATDAE